MPLELENKEWTTEFTPQDRAFMKQCEDSLKGQSFERGQLVSWDVQKHDWAPIVILPADDSTFYDEVSWPIFDLKRERALVHFVSNANGMLSGDGRTVLYVKVKGRWKRWAIYNRWIS